MLRFNLPIVLKFGRLVRYSVDEGV